MNTHQVEEYWCSEAMLSIKYVSHRDMLKGDYRHDNIRLGYWINIPSKTATILALKGCQLGPKYKQEDLWLKDKREW